MKFRYEWKTQKKDNPSFGGTESLDFLRGYCVSEKSSCSSTTDNKLLLNGTHNNNHLANGNVVINAASPTDMFCVPPTPNFCVPAVSNDATAFSLPLRPRPGRQPGRGRGSILKSQMQIPNNRICNNNSGGCASGEGEGGGGGMGGVGRQNKAVAINIMPHNSAYRYHQMNGTCVVHFSGYNCYIRRVRRVSPAYLACFCWTCDFVEAGPIESLPLVS